MKTKIAILAVIGSLSLWAVAQTSGGGVNGSAGANNQPGYAPPGGPDATPGQNPGEVTPGNNHTPYYTNGNHGSGSWFSHTNRSAGDTNGDNDSDSWRDRRRNGSGSYTNGNHDFRAWSSRTNKWSDSNTNH